MDTLKARLQEWIPYEGAALTRIIIGACLAAALVFCVIWNVIYSFISYHFDQMFNPLFLWQQLLTGQGGPLLGSALATFILIAVIIGVMALDHQKKGLHGRARWATEWDIKKAGLRDTQGLIIGSKAGRYLCSNTEGFVFGYAPTGTGKSVGFVIPNLLNYGDSAIVLDTKLELFKKTSGFRAQYQNVYLWAPGYTEGQADTERTHCFNPLDVVSRDPVYRIADLKRIAGILWPPENDKGDIWQPSARTLFTGMAMDVMDTGGHLSFGNLYRTFAQTDDIGEYLEEQLESHFDPENPLKLDALEIANINNFLQKANKERSGVISTFNAKMEIFEDPLVDAACSHSDFDVRDLRKERTTIYIGVNPSDLERLQPLLNLFFQLTITFLTRREPDPKDEPYKVFLCLDEFPRLGKIEKIKEGVDYLRSYGFRVMIIAQSLAKLREVYGEHAAENYMNNFQYIAAYAPNSQKEAKEISEMLGKKTVRQQTRSHSRNGVSVTTSYTGRELMKPDEVRRFTERKCLVIVRNQHPIKCMKVKWFKDKHLTSRVTAPIEAPLLNARTFKEKTDAVFYQKLADELRRKAEKAAKDPEESQSSRTQAPGSNQGAVSLAEMEAESQAMYGASMPKAAPTIAGLPNDDQKRLIDIISEFD